MNKKDYLKVLILMIGECFLIFGVLAFSNIIDFGEIDYPTALILGFGSLGFFLIRLNIDKILNSILQIKRKSKLK